ncbi:S8 family serine peptidase [Nonomuraea fuscirosea]|uniref:S8 family serine peptidase n=1 Tax=Nonomuraea fuscirosea TaxID=1291556 RepID=UPI0034288759
MVTRSRSDLPAATAAGTPLRTFSRYPVVTLRVDATGLDRLRTQTGVVSVTEDVPVPPILAESVPLIGGDKTRAAGLTGAGTAVAVLDTGVARTHPFLAGRVVAEACFSPSDAEYGATSLCPGGEDEEEGTGAADADQGPCAVAPLDCAHGTHVAGIAAGNGANVSGAPPAGVAPGANVVAIQVFSRFGTDEFCGAGASPCVLSFTSAQLSGLEKVLELKESGLPLVAANLSLGSGRYTADCGESDPRGPVIDDLLAEGVATVIAAGNDGYNDAVAAPACVSSGITVGSTTDDDGVSTFSNRGALLDLMAPGTGIVSSVPGAKWASLNGTSMAAPHVTGAFAVLRQKFPAKSVAELLTLMKSTGRPITNGSAVTPRLQLDAAALGSTPEPDPEDPAGQWPRFFLNSNKYKIPDPGKVESPLPVSGIKGSGPVYLHIWVYVVHGWIGDLQIDLVAPNGTVYNLQNPSPSDATSLSEVYRVNAGKLTTVNGTWKLRVNDAYKGDTGTISSWSLDVPFYENTDDYAIPDSGVVEAPITVTGWFPGNAYDDVTIGVDIAHTWCGDLQIDLVAPNGSVSKLLLPDPSDDGDGISKVFWVDARKFPANGTWKLRIKDVTAGDVGTLRSWWLKF